MSVPLPYDITPMKAVLGDLPSDPDGWAYEIKWDGMRALAFVDGTLTMRSTRKLEVADRFPELTGLAAGFEGHRVALDGEIVAFDEDLRSDFALLQQRMHVADRSEAVRRSADVPVTYVVFDLLHLDGIDTTGLTYVERRRLLVDLVEPGPAWQVPAHSLDNGAALLEAATERRLEGLMAKRTDSRYEPGRRSPAWRKVKIRGQQELVIGGWSAGQGNRSGVLGSLALGYHHADDPAGPLIYAGNVGTGFTAAELARVQRKLDDLAVGTCPFNPLPPRTILRTAHWVRPELVAEVAFTEWTPEGRLRHPAYLGLRTDKLPGEVVREGA